MKQAESDMTRTPNRSAFLREQFAADIDVPYAQVKQAWTDQGRPRDTAPTRSLFNFVRSRVRRNDIPPDVARVAAKRRAEVQAQGVPASEAGSAAPEAHANGNGHSNGNGTNTSLSVLRLEEEAQRPGSLLHAALGHFVHQSPQRLERLEEAIDLVRQVSDDLAENGSPLGLRDLRRVVSTALVLGDHDD